VIHNTEEYSARGWHLLLSAEDLEFMVDLVCNEPSLFLDKICERMYNNRGHLLSVSCIQQTLVNKLSITLKKQAPSTYARAFRPNSNGSRTWLESRLNSLSSLVCSVQY
jgi:hypothetical protein